MARRTLAQARTYREIHSALQHSPNLAGQRDRGEHTVYTGRNGKCVPVPWHNGDCPIGTLRSICRLARLAGLATVVLAVALAMGGALALAV